MTSISESLLPTTTSNGSTGEIRALNTGETHVIASFSPAGYAQLQAEVDKLAQRNLMRGPKTSSQDDATSQRLHEQIK